MLKKFLAYARGILLPEEFTSVAKTLKESQYKALSENESISKLLMYRSFVPSKGIKVGGKDGGIYMTGTDRSAAIFEISPPPYMTEEFENVIHGLLNKIVDDGTVVHVTVYASENIGEYVESFKEMSNFSNQTVKNLAVVDYLEKNNIKNFKKWSKESITSRGDVRVRNFHNIISVLFPENTKSSTMVSLTNEIGGALEKFHPVCLKPEKLVSILREIINPENAEVVNVDNHRSLESQIAGGASIDLSRDTPNFFIGNKTVATTYTTDMYPEVLQPLEFQMAFMSPFNDEIQTAIPCPFLMSLTIEFKDVEKTRKRALDKAKHNIGQLSSLPYMVEKKYPDVRDRRIEAEDTIYYAIKQNEDLIHGTFSITTFASTQDESERVGATLIKRFLDVEGAWRLKAETDSMVGYLLMLHSLPANFTKTIATTLRKDDLMFKSNNAQVSPLISGIKGYGGMHLTYIDKTGQMIRIEPLSLGGTNYNFIITGPMGSGKSFFINDFLYKSFRIGFKIRVVDIGRSYKPLCEGIGGRNVEFTEDNNICLNFFTNIKTQKVNIIDKLTNTEIEIEIPHEDEYSTIIPLVGMMAGVSLSVDMLKQNSTVESELIKKNMIIAVEEAVKTAFLRKGKEANLEDVIVALESMSENIKSTSEKFYELYSQMINALGDFGKKGGKYYQYFNGVNNINFDNTFFILELEELSQNKKELLPIITLAFLQKVGEEAFLDDVTPMVIAIDEAKLSLENPLFAAALDDYARRFRKYKKFLLIATQYIDDFFATKKSASLYSGATYKVILPSGRSSIESAVQKKYLHVSEFHKLQIANCQNVAPDYSEFAMIIKDDVIIARLKVTREESWIYSTNPRDKDRRRDVIQKYGFSLVEAITYLSVEDDLGITGDDAIAEMRNRLSSEDNERIEKENAKLLKIAIDQNKLIQYKFPIVDINSGEIKSYEVLSKIPNTTDGGEISAGALLDVAKKYDLYIDFIKAMTLECFEYFSGNDDIFSINLNAIDIMNDELFEYHINMIVKYGFKHRLSIEINSIREIIDAKKDIFVERVLLLKEHKINIAFDNIDIKNFNMEYIILIKPESIKIDSNIIKNIDYEELKANEALFVKHLTSGLKNFNIKVIAVFIKDEETLNACREMKIDCGQGYAISKPTRIEKSKGIF